MVIDPVSIKISCGSNRNGYSSDITVECAIISDVSEKILVNAST